MFRTCVDYDVASSASSSSTANSSDIYRIITWLPWECNILNKPTVHSHWNVINPASSILNLKIEFFDEPPEELISTMDTSVSNVTVRNINLERSDKGSSGDAMDSKSKPNTSSTSNSKNSNNNNINNNNSNNNNSSNNKSNNNNCNSAANTKAEIKVDNTGLISKADFDNRCSRAINGKWYILYSNSSKNVVIQDITPLILKEKTLIEYKTENIAVAVDATLSSCKRFNYKFTTYSNKYLRGLDYDGKLRNLAAYRYEIVKRYHALDGLLKFPDKFRRMQEHLLTPVGSMDMRLECGPNKQLKTDVNTVSYLALERLQHGNVVTICSSRDSNMIGLAFEDGIVQFRSRETPSLELAGQCEDSSAALRTKAPLLEDGDGDGDGEVKK